MSGRCRRNAQLLSPVFPLLLLLFASLLSTVASLCRNSLSTYSGPGLYDNPAAESPLSCHWVNSSLRQFCRLGEPSAASEAIAELSSGLLRVPFCEQLQLDWVLPQFPGCEGLLAALGDAESNVTAAQSLACHCLKSVANISADVSRILGEFGDLIHRLFQHRHNTSVCLDYYQHWLCTAHFSMHRDPSDPASLVTPCPEWCQAVETECPYLTPDNDTNSGEPVFLCHEDSYKGSGRSDRCTQRECCCYEAAAANRSSVRIACTSQLSTRRTFTTNMNSIKASDVAYNVSDTEGASMTHRLSMMLQLLTFCLLSLCLQASCWPGMLGN